MTVQHLQRVFRRSPRSPRRTAGAAVLLGVFGCWAAAPAAAEDQTPADVTITVVENPEQLKEKINKIVLPEASEATAHQSGHRSDVQGGQNSSEDHDRDQSAEGAREASEHAQSAADAAQADADDGRQQAGQSQDQ